MADGGTGLRSGGDGPSVPGASSRRRVDRVFSWSAPSPSPDDIAGLERMFPEVIQLPTAALDRELEDWTASGVIARSLSRWVPSEAVIRELRRAGLAGRIDTISLAHRTLLLKFELPAARTAALLQPWIVNGQPLAVEPWRPDFVPAEDALQSALLWIRLPNLPIEYWNEETLRSILSVAGQFVEADAFTKEKRRGSFARACVRVDLCKPLRPGARFRGHGTPFWQQFMYEHVDCICPNCGSIHLSGPCSSSPEQGSSAAAPLFGPWMAALRHRKPSPALLNVGDLPGKAVAEESTRKGKGVALGDQEGWRKPAKVSRRRSVPSSSLPNVAFIHSEYLEEGLCRDSQSVQVTIHAESELSLVPVAGSGGSLHAAYLPNVQMVSKGRGRNEKGPCRDSHTVPVTVHSESGLFSAPVADPEDSLQAAILPSDQKNSKGRRKKNPLVNQTVKMLSTYSIFQFKAQVPSDQVETPSMAKGVEGVVSQPGSQLPVDGKVAANPFTLIGSDRWAGCPKVREDANPASLKRARATEFSGPRISPKPSKGKGRVPSLSKGPSVKADPPPQGKDAHEIAFSTLKDVLAVSPSVPRGVGSHLLDRSADAPMEPDQQPALHDQIECQLPDQGLPVQCTASADITDMIMSGNQGGT